MTDSLEAIHEIARARGDVAAERACLRCTAAFWSEGFGERIFARCKGTASWRTAAPVGNGQGRRSSASRHS